MFAILVLMALFTTFMTTPIVKAIYKPYVVASQSENSLERQNSPKKNSKKEKELRILACIHGPESVPSLINLIESTRTSSENSPLKVYVMHLVELTDRSSSIMMVHRVRKNGFPSINRFCRGGVAQGQIASAVEVYGQVGQVTIRHTTAISAFSTMHEDILHVAEAKRVPIIILPFNKQRNNKGEQTMEDLGHHWKVVNERVLKCANCSVALFVDRGFGVGAEKGAKPLSTNIPRRVCILFLGGPDDRKALEYGGGIANQSVEVTVVNCLEQSTDCISPVTDPERELNDATVTEFRRQNGSVKYIEVVVVGNIKETVVGIGQSRDYDLVIVGKDHHPSTIVADLAHNQLEHTELGPIGDTLASSSHGILCSVLVIQTPQISK